MENEHRVKTITWYSFDEEDAMAVIRMLGPAKFANLEVIRGIKNRVVDVDAAKNGDLVILGREFAVDYNHYEKVVRLARSLKKPIILDLDDFLLALPENHPDRLGGYYSPAMLPLLQSIFEADLLTVATLPLRENLLPYNPAIEVLPNYLDDSLWHCKEPQKDVDPARPITIGYMGGHSHTPDLMLVLPALTEIINKYPGHIHFHFWGIEPPAELAAYSRVDWVPRPSKRYEEFAAYFQQQEMDIAIAPLADNLFNSCKSAIKFLEYSAIGAAGVYSRITPYTSIIDHEIDGMLAATPEDWVAALSRLIESPALRLEQIRNAQAKIKQSWLLSQNLEKRLSVYDQLIANYQPDKKVYPFFFELEKSITRQLYEQHLRDYQELSERTDSVKYLTQRAEDQDRRITEQEEIIARQTGLENEVMAYVTSRSWKLTRPLRKIMKKW
ncbi:MAG TPA: glycosyltransferase [Anaerolineales bacterium]|nr:glycosyltransferase [Anaerolineales bacterium]